MRATKPRRLAVTRYVLADGTRAKKGDRGAKKKREQTQTWYATLPGERRPTSLGTDDQGEAWVRLRRLLREREDRAAGIRTDVHDHAATPLLEHLEAFTAMLAAKGTGGEHIKVIRAHVRDLSSEAKWSRFGDVTAESCLAALASLQHRLGLSAQTRNHYLGHAQQFLRWACGLGRRWRDNPLIGLSKLNVETDERHPRRRPTEEEIRTLFGWLATGREPEHSRTHTSRPTDGTSPVRRWMSGPHRALGYKVAMATGLRAGEVRSLRRNSFDLEAGTVTVVAGYSKHRRKDVQPLPSWLIPELRAWFDAGGSCWHWFNEKGGEVLQWDLEGCGVPYQTDEGFFDWHSLRIFYVSALAEDPENTIKVLMELARHSTPTLTLKLYARVRRISLEDAVNRLANPMAEPAAESGRRVGG